jgi:hypothetical protein
MRGQTEFVAWSFASLTSVGAGIASSLQMLVDPDDAWVPVGVLVTLLALSIVTTVKVVRLLDGIRADIRLGRAERARLAAALGIDLERDA